MDKELVQLLEKLCDLPDVDLIKMVNRDTADYRSEALALARIVMKRRGYNLSRKGNIIENSHKQTEPDNASLQDVGGKEPVAELNKLLLVIYCPRCNAKLDYVGTRRLNEEKTLGVLGELGQMYKDGAHEFLDVYTCNHCGHVEFFVDGVGDELRPY
jgi:uncharacterized protein YbaR (Trm112 family)